MLPALSMLLLLAAAEVGPAPDPGPIPTTPVAAAVVSAGAAAAAPDEEGADEAEGTDEASGLGDDARLLHAYTADLDDAELARRFVEEPASLGSISVGVAEAGRVINAVQMPRGEGWTIVDPTYAWGAQETIDAIQAVARALRDRFPDTLLRVNHIGRRNGGWLRPHRSHQSGRDVDLGLFRRAGVAPAPATPRRRAEPALDLARNWAVLRSLVVDADVQLVLVDRRVQKALYDHALAAGEPKSWLEEVFHGPRRLVQHARRHRDHFHVRFFAPRSQELGRRVQPILATRPDENLVVVRVKKGDTLGRIASRHASTVKAIRGANGLTGDALRVGRTLNVPMRGPCTRCPLPPPLLVPARLLPPEPGEV